jgi:hypothetical protein
LAAALALLLVVAAAGGMAVIARPGAVPPESIERLPEYHDAALLARAWALPVARLYGPAGYMYQSNPSICGPTSIADVLHSEGRPGDPGTVLQGAGIFSIFGILPGGLTLDQEAALLHRQLNVPVRTLRGLKLDDFRAEMAKSNDPAVRIIVNFTRAPLFGRGHGHFSPVLGYLAQRDLVFVGDVNAHYRPWLVPAARLFAAQDTVDPATHEKRGVLEVAVR